MLLRLDNPRLVINAQEFPSHVILMTLEYASASGGVTVEYVDSQIGSGSRNERSRVTTNSIAARSVGGRVTHPIEPTRTLPVLQGMQLHEYVLPFWDLHDNLGRRAATGGFHFRVSSAFRAQGAGYEERILDFVMQFPVIGGGVMRFVLGGQEWDIANPTFDPRARMPEINQSYGAGRGDEYMSGPPGIENKRVPDNVLINAYQRTHRGHVGPSANAIEQRRRDRLANFDLKEESVLAPRTEEAPEPPPLVGGSFREPARPMTEAERQAEVRRQERLASLRPRPEEGAPEAPPPSIILAPSRPAKAPPRTRFERGDD